MSTQVSPRSKTGIDPAALMAIKSLELRARIVVEGFLTGLHRSPYHGFSVEFTEYRQYTQGDDPRHLDWRVYARSDRYYVKRFEDETNLRCHLLLDSSRSMDYGSDEWTKGDYARTLAATLAYFLSQQRDAVGLIRFDDDVEEIVPARYRPGHLRRMFVSLERPLHGKATDLDRPLERVAGYVRKRGLLVLISDLLAPLDVLDTRLGSLRAQGHEVAVFQVLDPAELDFPFDQAALFVDVESGREFHVEPAQIRERYDHRLRDHLEAVQTACRRHGITWQLVRTDEPLEHVLAGFLRAREMSGPRVRRDGSLGRRSG